MVRSPGVEVPRDQAEATRRRLRDEGVLRDDLAVLETEEGIVFPVDDDDGEIGSDISYDFLPRALRPRSYLDLLDWSERDRQSAPRSFDAMGDIVVLKVPEALWDRRDQIGRALIAFLPAVRAVFHDHGVKGDFRTRQLERIAGDGSAETLVLENGCRFHVDVTRAYFSPRLADERARIAALVGPGESVVDLFGGVAPFGVQAARAGATVLSIDINPDACALARRNASENKVQLEVVCGDAREVAAGLGPADRVIMNLPHAARDFLDVAARLVKPGGTVHHHEILAKDLIDARGDALGREVERTVGRGAEVTHVRHVRDYSPAEAHIAFDIRVAS